jgi:hypothetical protein
MERSLEEERAGAKANESEWRQLRDRWTGCDEDIPLVPVTARGGTSEEEEEDAAIAAMAMELELSSISLWLWFCGSQAHA